MKVHLLAGLLFAGAAVAGAQEQSPLWLRNVAISPDGAKIAFTFKGDIFTVPVSGGDARQITSNSAYDSSPVWSPDGTKIAFSSDRCGTDDVYIVDANGGTPRRLTTDSGKEVPVAFLDNNTLMFITAGMPSPQSIRGSFGYQLPYTIDVTVDSPRPKLYLSVPIREGVSVSSSGVLYADRKGVEDVYRKHERSSGTADVWLYKNGDFKQLTTFNGHDQNPVWAPDGKSFYYLSEEDGTLNVYRAALDGSSKKQLTHFAKHPVRGLSIAADGTLAFSWDGEIYTIKDGAEPAKVNIRVSADDYDSDLVKGLRSQGASSFAVSPDGSEIAIVIRGDIFVTSTKYQTTKRITNTAAQERCVEFSPDGRTLVYDSDRDGYWQLFTAKIKSDDEKSFAYATDIEETPLYKCFTSAQQPSFSPDGKKVAFLENRTILRVIDLKTKAVTTALDGKFNYSYSDGDVQFRWSPDSRWLLASYIGEGGWNNIDVALVKADGSQVVDLTESGFTDSNPKWAMDGKAITYETAKYGLKSHGSWGNTGDIMFMALDGEAWDAITMTEEEAALAEKVEQDKKDGDKADKKDDKKSKKDDKKKKGDKAEEEAVKPLNFELADRNYRKSRLTPSSAYIYDYYLSPKGDKLYYLANQTEGGFSLFERDLRKGDTKVLAKGMAGGLEADSKGENLFVMTQTGLTKVSLADGSTTPVEYSALYDRKPSQEREYIYDHMLRQVNDKFYDENLHGVDWDYYGQHYRQFLPYISNNRDFAILLSEILGELNASHTGGRYYSNASFIPVASLGAFYDEDYAGNGLKVAEVLHRGPLSAKQVGVEAGDIILSIDGEEIQAGKDYNNLLEGKVGRKTLLKVKKANGKEVSVKVKPISKAAERNLLYQRWVERNEAIVDSLSGGKVGYVHVQGMNTDSYNTAYDRILGKYRNCDAVIVDTRYNGGGWLHNDLAVLLSGKEYVRFTPRGRYIGSEPFSQWYKPSVMLVNESNYSDAHGSPYTYQALGLGDVVGAPIPGTMTAVWWETQIDPTLIFGIPQVTNSDLNGNALENHQLTPDVIIYNRPADIERGVDSQLEGAVKHLLKKVAQK